MSITFHSIPLQSRAFSLTLTFSRLAEYVVDDLTEIEAATVDLSPLQHTVTELVCSDDGSTFRATYHVAADTSLADLSQAIQQLAPTAACVNGWRRLATGSDAAGVE